MPYIQGITAKATYLSATTAIYKDDKHGRQINAFFRVEHRPPMVNDRSIFGRTHQIDLL